MEIVKDLSVSAFRGSQVNINMEDFDGSDVTPFPVFIRRSQIVSKVEKILNGSLDSIPSTSTSVKIQTMSGKVCLRCKGKMLLGFANKLLKTRSLLTSPSNVLPHYLK